MAVRIFICLVLLSTILAEESGSKLNTKPRKIYPTLSDDIVTTNKEENIVVNVEVNKNQETNTDVKLNNTTEVKPTESNLQVSDKDGMDTASSQVYYSQSPSSYEVYENLIDIPDDRTPSGPVVPYTKPPVLNTVRPINNTHSSMNGNTIEEVTEPNFQSKKSKFSILHIKAEYDNENKIDTTNKVPGIFKGIKEYFNGLHKGFIHGIHSLFNKDTNRDKQKRSADIQTTEKSQSTARNTNDVDATDFFVRHRHISLT